LAKSPCRGFATRNFAAFGSGRRGGFFARETPPSRQEQAASPGVLGGTEGGVAIMLGRHVYRVYPADRGWGVTKEGEPKPRAVFARREEALEEACRLARGDEPARVTVDNRDGTIAEERLFGADPGSAIG
jgi:hypothetical protein